MLIIIFFYFFFATEAVDPVFLTGEIFEVLPVGDFAGLVVTFVVVMVGATGAGPAGFAVGAASGSLVMEGLAGCALDFINRLLSGLVECGWGPPAAAIGGKRSFSRSASFATSNESMAGGHGG